MRPSSSSGAKRTFSFQNVFHRKHSDTTDDNRPTSRGALSFISGSSRDHSYPGTSGATEEERAGLVHGESANILPGYSQVTQEPARIPEEERDSDEWQVTSGTSSK